VNQRHFPSPVDENCRRETDAEGVWLASAFLLRHFFYLHSSHVSNRVLLVNRHSSAGYGEEAASHSHAEDVANIRIRFV
jgi:hypothetical protein